MARDESTAIHDLIRSAARPFAGVVRDSEVTMIAPPRPRPMPQAPAPAYATPFQPPLYHAAPAYPWLAPSSYLPASSAELPRGVLIALGTMAILLGVLVGVILSIA